MLVLTRRKREALIVSMGGGTRRLLKVTVLQIVGDKVKLGFEGDAEISVHRLEVWERISAGGELDGKGRTPSDLPLATPLTLQE